MRALITGASGGLGTALAHELASRGYPLILSGRQPRVLTELSAEIKVRHGVDAPVLEQPLSTYDDADALWSRAKAIDPNLGIVVNNAGFGHFANFADSEWDIEAQMIGTNLQALTKLTKNAVLDMKKRGNGRILNVASTAAFMPGPKMAIYYATKAYVLSFSEALNEELRGTGVSVTCLCPGPTLTGFQTAAQMESSRLVRRRMMLASDVAEIGIDALEARRALVIPGFRNKIDVLMSRILPASILASTVRRAQAEIGPK